MTFKHLRRALLCAALISLPICVFGQSFAPCTRYQVGSSIVQPQDLFSQSGKLQVNFTYRSEIDSSGNTLFCFISSDGSQSPTLHVHPGDELIINLEERDSFVGVFSGNDRHAGNGRDWIYCEGLRFGRHGRYFDKHPLSWSQCSSRLPPGRSDHYSDQLRRLLSIRGAFPG